MNFQEYQNAIKTFKPHSQWHYSPNECENKLCCSSDEFDHENHGMILLGSQYEPIVICDDCLYQIENKMYDKKITKEGLK